jgi:uncharacterized protein YecE (DUF72 family)
VRRIAEEADDIYVITNNHFQGQAVANAAMLESMLRERPVPVPEPVVARYGAVLDGYVDSAISENTVRG